MRPNIEKCLLKKNIGVPYKGELVRIIFGCRASVNDMEIISGIAVSQNNDIKISKMLLDRSSFGLTMVNPSDNNDVIFSKENIDSSKRELDLYNKIESLSQY